MKLQKKKKRMGAYLNKEIQHKLFKGHCQSNFKFFLLNLKPYNAFIIYLILVSHEKNKKCNLFFLSILSK